MCFACVFEAVYVCVCAGQSMTGSIVKAFETLLRYPMLLVPTGSASLMLSCRSTSSPISCWCCLQRLAAAPVVTLINTYLRFWSSWTHASASSSVGAACRMLWTCISILHMWHSCHHMLGVRVWACVLLPRLLFHHLLALPWLCVGACCVLLRIPPVFWDQVLCLLFTAVAWGCPWLGRALLPWKIHSSCCQCWYLQLQCWTRAAVLFVSLLALGSVVMSQTLLNVWITFAQVCWSTVHLYGY